MKRFIESSECTSRTRCENCRDQGERGKVWRGVILLVFETPGNALDFECPFGVAWGFKLPPVVKPRPPEKIPDGWTAEQETPSCCA